MDRKNKDRRMIIDVNDFKVLSFDIGLQEVLIISIFDRLRVDHRRQSEDEK